MSLLIAMVFNPFVEIYLEKSTWQFLDVISAVFYFSVSATFLIEYFVNSKKKN